MTNETNIEYNKYLEKLKLQRENYEKIRYDCKFCYYTKLGLLISSGFFLHCLILESKRLEITSLKKKGIFVLSGLSCYYLSYLMIKKNIK